MRIFPVGNGLVGEVAQHADVMCEYKVPNCAVIMNLHFLMDHLPFLREQEMSSHLRGYRENKTTRWECLSFWQFRYKYLPKDKYLGIFCILLSWHLSARRVKGFVMWCASRRHRRQCSDDTTPVLYRHNFDQLNSWIVESVISTKVHSLNTLAMKCDLRMLSWMSTLPHTLTLHTRSLPYCFYHIIMDWEIGTFSSIWTAVPLYISIFSMQWMSLHWLLP